jgi:hypothetical protein
MPAASIRATATLTLAIAATLLPTACRSAAVDEPPKAAMIEQSPAPPPPPAPAAPAAGELPLALGDTPKLPAPPRAPTRRHPANDVAQPPAPLEIGAPCPAPAAAPEDRAPSFDPCGTKGRVAVRWNAFSASLARAAPCTMVNLGEGAKPGNFPPGGHIPSACVKDGQLFARSTCVVCRLPGAGWNATALIAEMTRDQALACQKRLGLPTKEPLLTAEAWTKALAAAAPS